MRVSALFAAIWIALAACGDDRAQEPAAKEPAAKEPAAKEPAVTSVLAHPPHLGVTSCGGEPNVITCDRIGLAVWLSTRATALEAWIGGKPVAMTIRPNSAEREGRGRFFVGYLHPAGLSSPGPLHVTPDGPGDYWAGGNPVSAPVRLVVHYPDGSSAEITVQTELQPGWG